MDLDTLDGLDKLDILDGMKVNKIKALFSLTVGGLSPLVQCVQSVQHVQCVQVQRLRQGQGQGYYNGEYRSQGFSAQRHPLALLRQQLRQQGIITSDSLPSVAEDATVSVAGVVVCRQRPPTAKGFAFLTIEDEFGMMNVIIHPKLYESVRPVFRQSPMVYVTGIRNERESVINIRAIDLQPL